MDAARVPDWTEKLFAFVEARRSLPFAWGTNDCVMFAADCAIELTGVDPMTAYRGKYNDAAGAARVLRAADGFVVGVGKLLPAIAVAEAQRGDWVLVRNDGRPGIAVVIDDRCVGPGAVGLSFVPVSEATDAWRV